MSTEQAQPSGGRSLRIAVCADVLELGADAALERLTAAGHTVHRLAAGDGGMTILAGATDADVLMLGYGIVDERVLEQLPSLKLIALASMGVDNVDVEAARRRGIVVTNVLGAATEEVATHALALALDAIRGITGFARAVEAGVWSLEAETQPKRASELTLGLVGLGRIGLAVADRARAIFGRILGVDPALDPQAAADRGVTLTSVDELLAASDVVSLHLPLTQESRGFLNAATLDRMRPGAILINVSRGGLVDVAAVREALDTGRLACVALDVLDEEPPRPDHPLVGHPRAVITPHVGFLSASALADYVNLQADNVLSWARSGAALSPV